MLGVYDILCLALLGMAFSSLCFTNVLSTLMLRKQFVHRAPLAPLQGKITRGLQLALGLCILTWITAFLWGAAATARALMQGQVVPLFFLLFSPIFSGAVSFVLFRKTLRVRTRDTEELAKELKELYAARAASVSDSAVLAAQLGKGSAQDSSDIRKKAFRAVLLLGEPSYHETLQRLQSSSVITETQATPLRQSGPPPPIRTRRLRK